MILKQKLTYAQSLLTELQKIKLPFYHLFFQLTITFLQKIIIYCQTKNEAPIIAIIDNLVNMNCQPQAQKYIEIFKDVQQIWSK